MKRILVALVILLSAVSAFGGTYTIDFEEQPESHERVAREVVSGFGTFNGGTVWHVENDHFWKSKFYYTVSGVHTSFASVIRVHFVNKVKNLQFDLANGYTAVRRFTVTGGGQSRSGDILPFIEPGDGRNVVHMSWPWSLQDLTIEVSQQPFAFGIDNLTFDDDSTPDVCPLSTSTTTVSSVETNAVCAPERLAIQVDGDVNNTVYTQPITKNMTVTLPFGARFQMWVERRASDGTWFPGVAAKYKVTANTVSPALPTQFNAVKATTPAFPKTVLFPFSGSNAEFFPRFQIVHGGKATVEIRPNDRDASLPSTVLSITTYMPDQLGPLNVSRLGNRPNVFDYDSRIVQLAHERGIPPQFFKGQIEQETGSRASQYFNPKTWRYEPITVDYGKPWGPNEFSSVSIDNPSAPADKRGQLFMASKSPWIEWSMTFALNSLTAADKAPRESLYHCGPLDSNGKFPKIGPNDPQPTVREILQTNPLEHFDRDVRDPSPQPNYQCGGAPAGTATNRRRASNPMPDQLNFTAQTPLASSYGLMQMIHAYVFGGPYYWKGASGQFNPSLLFDDDQGRAILAEQAGPLGATAGTLYLGTTKDLYLYRVKNNLAETPVYSESAYDDTIYNAMQAYTGGGVEEYGDHVMTYADSYNPQMRGFVFSACSEPTKTSQTSSAVIAQGGTATLGFDVNSGATPDYDWYVVTPTGRTRLYSAERAVIAVQPTQTTTYVAVATNGCGSVTSDPITVTVAEPCAKPSIAAAPSATLTNADATLTVNATNATALAWVRDDGTYIPFPLPPGRVAGTTPSITVTRTTSPQYFRVIAENACGEVASEPVTVPPLGSCPVITQAGSSIGTGKVSPGTAVTLTAAASGDSVQYQWVDQNETPIGTGPSVVVTPAATMQYAVIATNSCGTDRSSWIEVKVQCDTPVITAQPQPVTMTEGTHATLSLVATGATSIEWLDSSGTAVGSGASIQVSPSSATTYHARLTNACGTIDSSDVTVTVVPMCVALSITEQPTPERYISSGQMVPLGVRIDGTSPAFQWYRHDRMTDANTPIAGQTGATYGATSAGDYFVRITNACSTIDSNMVTIFAAAGCSPLTLAVSEDAVVGAGTSTTLYVTAFGTAPYTYKWSEELPDGTVHILSGTNTSITVTPTAETTRYWATVTNPCGTTARAITITLCHPPAITGQPVPPIFTADNQTASMHVEATGTHLMYQWLLNGVAVEDATSADVVVTSRRFAQTYQVAVTNECGTSNSGNIIVPAICNAPAITQQPASTIIRPGGTAHLSVTATGNRADNSDITGYQWYRGNAFDTSNPLGTTPSIDVTPEVTTPYWVAVKGNCAAPGDVATYSATATVTVCANPAITATTGDIHIAAGQQASLNVVASGTSLTYQWFEGASGDTSKPQSGAAAHIYTPSPTVTTSYWARVTSQGVCTTDSTTMTVHVCRPAVITTQPASVKIASGASATLHVTLDADPPDTPSHYTWFEGAAGDLSHPAGTDSATLTVTPTADTSYWVRIGRDVCPIDSAVANVTVCALAASVDPEALLSAGQSVILHSYVSNARPDAAMLYSWYQGNSGDRTNLIVSSPQSANISVTPTAATTTYWLEVSDGTCTVNGGSEIVRICVPRITTQPTGTMINSGQSAHLTVTADGGALTYQWYTGSTGNTASPVSGATGAAVDVSPTSATSYWVRVTGTCGRSADSAAATVTICAPPSITRQPSPSSITRGQSTTVSVTATGDGLSYQWYSGAVGSTTSPFGTNAASQSVNPQVTTDYWVKVSGTCGTQNSSGVKVSVAPIFTTQPASVRITRGTAATFSVSIDGTQLAYQWFAGNSPYGTAINGATNASYTTPPLSADAAYYVRVTSGNYVVNSNDATATICAAPSVNVSQGPSQLSGAAVTLSIVDPSGTDTYAWYRGNAGDTTNPVGSGTAAVVYPTATTNYWVRQTGGGCYADSATISVPICTPAITAQPQNASIVAGNTATLSVTATGTATLTYQWYSGAVGTTTSPVANGTTSTVTVQPGTTTSYWCRVTSPGGCSANSNGATVTVCNPPIITTNPGNPTITRGQITTLGVAATGSNLAYQWYQGAVGVTTSPMGTTSTQQVNPQVTTDYWVKVSNTCGSQNSTAAKVSVYPIFNTQPQPVLLTRGTAATFSVGVDASQVSYQWYQGQPGTGTLVNGASNASYTTPALTADTSYYVRVTSGNAIAYSDAATATIFVSPSVTYSQNAGQTSGASVTLSIVNPNGTDTYAWYRGTSGNTSSFIGNTGTSGVLVQNPTQSTSYWVRTTRGSCSADSVTITIPICTPAITAQPQNAGVIAPNSTTLSVTATGEPTLTYQWYTGTSGSTASPISGATGPTVSVTPSQNTSYWVRVTNGSNPAACYVNSNTATVTVCNLPTITKQPTNAYVPQGWTSTTVGVTATGATSYTWYLGQSGDTSHAVATVTTATYTFSPVQTDYYWVRVSNSCGYRDSTACLVSVYPVINSAPQDVHLTAGSTAKFTVSASGSYLHYQWTMNNVNVGTDAPTFSTTINADASIGCTITSGMTSSGVWAGAYLCSGPNVTSGPAKTTSGSCRMLSIMSDDYSATYQWYRGARGDTSAPVASGNYVSVCPTTATTYWCRITSGDTGCYTDSGTVTAP